jgi:heme/copper-type cytochrome/quinol oxidase subunit 1
MVKGLKVAMIIWAAIAILVGLAYIFIPRQLGEMGGFEKGPAWVAYILALLGICFVATGVFVIIAAAQSPMKNIMWLL